MRAWWTLVKKELRTTQGLLYLPLGLVLLIGGLHLWTAHVDPTGMPSVMAVTVVMLLSFYLPGYLLISSFREMKHTGHLWLHLPQSGWALLSAKVAAGAVYSTVMFVASYVMALWVFGVDESVAGAALQDPELEHFVRLFREHQVLAYLDYLLVSLYQSMWALLLFSSVAAMKYRNSLLRWIVGLAVFFAPGLITMYVDQAAVSFDMSLWGAFVTPESNGQAHMGEMLLYVLQVAALFAFSGWLLDRKVEV